MRKPGGYALWSGGREPAIERDTFTCIHCNTVVFVPPASDPTTVGGFCVKCMRHICATCADTGTCTPFEKQLEAMESTITQRIENDRSLAKILRS